MIQLLKNRMSSISSNLYEGNRPITYHVLKCWYFLKEKSSIMNGTYQVKFLWEVRSKTEKKKWRGRMRENKWNKFWTSHYWVGKTLTIAWKVSKYVVFSGPYFPVFMLNTEPKKLRIWTVFTQWMVVEFDIK